MVNFKPDGCHSLTPIFCVNGSLEFVEFLKKAFDVTEVKACSMDPSGNYAHVEIKVGDSWIMGGEAGGPHKPNQNSLYLYVQDTDKIYKQALQAGATSLQEPADQFYGDRNAGVKDKWGNAWFIGTHIEDVPPAELEQRAKAFHAKKEAVTAK